VRPETRFAVTLLASLTLWAPTLVACLEGNADLPTTAERYLLALVVAWLAIAAFNALLMSFHKQNAVADAERDADALANRLAQLDAERIEHGDGATAIPGMPGIAAAAAGLPPTGVPGDLPDAGGASTALPTADVPGARAELPVE
jgi:hypothetical protein